MLQSTGRGTVKPRQGIFAVSNQIQANTKLSLDQDTLKKKLNKLHSFMKLKEENDGQFIAKQRQYIVNLQLEIEKLSKNSRVVCSEELKHYLPCSSFKEHLPLLRKLGLKNILPSKCIVLCAEKGISEQFNRSFAADSIVKSDNRTKARATVPHTAFLFEHQIYI